jgi:predicted phage-related endonuclease
MMPSFDLGLPMELHQLEQGTAEWLAFRRRMRPASLAAVAMGCSPFMTRTELLDALTTGLWPEADEFQQEIFAKGHFVEKAYRSRAEEFIAQALYPIVVSRGLLSASMDGFFEDERGNWECKWLNKELQTVLPHKGWAGCDLNDARGLPKFYRVQMEQQCMVGGIERVLFTAVDVAQDGTVLDERLCWYESDPDLAMEIIATWKQFEADLVTHRPVPKVQKVAAEAVEALPVLTSRVDGALVVTHNFDVFGTQLRAYIATLPIEPKTDQDFANLADAVKRLDDAEKELDKEEERALASLEPINRMRAAKKTLRDYSSTTRLKITKVVDARKATLRQAIVIEHRDAYDKWVREQNEAIGIPLLSTSTGTCPDALIAEGMSGKKSIAGWREGAAQAVADAKIKAGAVVERLQKNLAKYKELVTEEHHKGLFADLHQLVFKDPEAFAIIVGSKISDWNAKEEKRLAKIKEDAKAEAEQKLRDEQAAAAPAPTPAPTAAPTAAPTTAPTPAPARGYGGGNWLERGAPVAPGHTVRNDLAEDAAVTTPLRLTPDPMPPAATSGEATLGVTALSARLKFTVTGAFLESLGVLPVIDGNARRYREADFPRICIAIRNHLLGLMANPQGEL